MDLTTAERDRRWGNLRNMMKTRNVDALLTFSDFGDQVSLQRYVSNFRSSYDFQATVLYHDGCDVVLTHPGGIPIAKMLSWGTEVLPMAVPNVPVSTGKQGASAGGQVANRLAEHGVKSVGVPGMEFFPVGWKEKIEAAIPDVEFVDVWDEFHLIRLVKGDEELALVREACRISDEVWKKMPEIVQVGRKRYEVLADIEQMIRAAGCEDSFNLCMSMPMLREQLDRNPYSGLPIEAGGVYLIEVSPRFLGYFGQQTKLVAIDTVPDDMRAAYEAVNRARDKGLAIAKPGVDLVEIQAVIAEQLRADGFEPAGPSFGHAVGLELEDHHIDGSSLVLEAGMTFIFHPMVANHPAVMRADTFVVTDTGVERLTTGDTSLLELGRS